jgi:hypothetical protein
MDHMTSSPPLSNIKRESTSARLGPVALSQRLEITRDLLDALDDATRPGQAHVMRRILNILQSEILRPSLSLSGEQVAAVMAAVTELEHEAGRAAPDAGLFGRGAQIVIDLLSTT